MVNLFEYIHKYIHSFIYFFQFLYNERQRDGEARGHEDPFSAGEDRFSAGEDRSGAPSRPVTTKLSLSHRKSAAKVPSEPKKPKMSEVFSVPPSPISKKSDVSNNPIEQQISATEKEIETLEEFMRTNDQVMKITTIYINYINYFKSNLC